MAEEKRVFLFVSALKGIRVMHFPNRAIWGIRFMPKRFWFHFWTPKWHEGNGPYLSAGFWVFAVFRGY